MCADLSGKRAYEAWTRLETVAARRCQLGRRQRTINAVNCKARFGAVGGKRQRGKEGDRIVAIATAHPAKRSQRLTKMQYGYITGIKAIHPTSVWLAGNERKAPLVL